MNELHEHVNPTELLYKLLTEQGETRAMLKQILQNQETINTRINKRESETEILAKDLTDFKVEMTNRVSKVESVQDNNKTWLIIVGTLAAAGGALLSALHGLIMGK